MRNTLLISLLLALGLTACGKKEEAAQPAVPAMEPAPAAAPAPEAAAPAAADPVAQFTSQCASCHGPSGQGQGAFPKLAGQTADAIKAKLADYKAGKQVGAQSALMFPIAQKLSDEEIDALSAHIATLQ
jgi:cytochrome c553